MGIKCLWTAFAGTWIVMLGYAVALVSWANSEHHEIRAQMTAIDKTQSIQMARVETELKQIGATLIEIKQQMNCVRTH